MFKRLIGILLFFQLASLVGCAGRTESPVTMENSSQRPSDTVAPATIDKETVPAGRPLPFEIVEEERLKKGGSLEPPLAPQYVLFRVNAVVTDVSSELTEPKVRAALRALLNEVRERARRRGERIDGVSAFLYQSRDHINGGSSPLGRAEWWPKGHSFSPNNVANIKNKATYVEEIGVFHLPKPAKTAVQRLSEHQRRAIFAELVRAEDRAMREAEAQYPINTSNIPIDKLKTYDFKTAIEQNMKVEKELRAKYKREIMQRHKLTEQEIEDIKKEARIEQWPLPPQ